MPSPTPHRQPPPRPITEASRRPALLATVALLVCAGALGWLVLRPRPLPILGAVPAFALVDQTGARVASNDLTGRPWVANFIFTRCPDVCPALTARMAQLRTRLGPSADEIRLVSFSVDPVHDTPEVLQSYARKVGAPAAWRFVTGSREALATLLRDGFQVAFADDGPPTAPITHSDRFVLIDRELRIRGYYRGGEEDDLTRLARDTATLVAHPAL